MPTPSAQETATVDPSPSISVNVEFTGGLELLFSSQRSHKMDLPAPASSFPTIGTLIAHITQKYLVQSPKKELFVLDGTVRPGILVLLNDADWELEGQMEAELRAGDEVVFVSTLHGGPDNHEGERKEAIFTVRSRVLRGLKLPSN